VTEDEVDDVARVAKGDRAAFARLAQRHMPALEAYALRMLNNSGTAQDVTQEVLLQLWLRAGEFDPTRARLTTWLHRMAHNRCIDQLRSSQRVEVCADPEVGTVNPPAEPAPEAGPDEASAVQQGLAALPERQRNALVLTYYQDFSNQEVADIMGMGIRAVESLLVRARKALRQHLEEAQ